MARAGAAAFVLGTVLGLGVGAAIGFVAGTGGPPGATGPGDAATAPGRGGDADPPATGGSGGASASRDRTRRAAADPLLGLIPADVAAPPADANGVIRGAVRDAEGRGIPGVRIDVTPDDDDFPGLSDDAPATTPEERLRRQVARVVAGFRWTEGRRRTAVTGPEGTWSVAGIDGSRYEVEPDAEGWDFDRVGDRWLHAGDFSVFRGTRRIGVPIDVRLPDGKPPEDADVTAEIASGGNSSSWSWAPDDMEVNLAAGEWFLRARSGEFDEWASERVRVTVADDGKVPAVRLDLAPRLGFGGRVLPPADAAHAPDAVWIAHMAVDRADVPSDEDVLLNGDDDWVEPGDTWNQVNVEPGRYAIVAAVRGRRVIWREVVEVTDRFVRRDVQIPPGDLGDTIVARALAPDGSPVEDLEWRTGIEIAGESGEAEVAARPLGDGRFRLPLHEPDAPNGGYEQTTSSSDDGPPGLRRRWVTAVSPKYGETRVDHAPDSRAEVTVQFAPPATVEFVVDGSKGRAMRSLRLRLDREGASRGEEWESRREENPGTIRLGPFPAGPATLTVRMYCQDGDEFHVSTRPLALAAGTNRVVVALPPTQDITIRTDAPGADLEMSSIDPADGRDCGERVDGDEGDDEVTFTWVGVPHGRYLVHDDDLGEMTLTVPCADVVRFTPRAWNALVVDLAEDDEEDAPFYAAGMRDGDVCVAVNGREFSGPSEVYTLLAAAALQPKAKLTFVRGRERVEVEVEAKRLRDLDWEMAAR